MKPGPKPRPRAQTVCPGCGVTFQNNPNGTKVYCSQKCYFDKRRLGAVRECLTCGAPFQRHRGLSTQRYCSISCGQRARRAGRPLSPTPGKQRKWLLMTHTGCDACGWSVEPGVLEVHHKDGDRFHNTPDNLALLCPTCHALTHFRGGTFGKPPHVRY